MTSAPKAAFALAASVLLAACASRSASSDGSDGEGDVRTSDASESAEPHARDAGALPASTGSAGAQAVAWPFLPAVPAACLERQLEATAPLVKTTISDVVVSHRWIGYESEAFVVMREACHLGPRLTGAPCRPFVVLADTRYAGVKEPMTPASDLVVFVDDVKQWELFARYRIQYALCGGGAARAIGASLLR